jgi:hypothetical protein
MRKTAAAGAAAPVATLAKNLSAQPMMLLLGLLLVLAYGRLVEKIPIPGLVLGLSLVLLIYGLFNNPQLGWVRKFPSVLLIGLTAWMMPSGLFGDWPGGSVQFLIHTWSRVVVFYVLVVILGRDLGSVRHIMSAMAWATATIVILGLWQSQDMQGRVGLDETASLSNPNDLAVFLLVGLPFCGWYAADSRRAPLLRLAMGGVLACGLFALLRTGSRMGLLALLAMLVQLFFVAGRRLRLVVAAGAVLLLAAALVFLPDMIGRRYLTIVTSGVEDVDGSHEIAQATDSTRDRWELFVNSLIVTARHPLLGVGPGNYTVANAELGREAGERPIWQQSHNSYTQVSAELGLPGGIMFLLLVGYCLVSSRRMWRAAGGMGSRRPEAIMALCLMVASLGYAVCALFGSIAYGLHLQLLSGLVLSLDLVLYSKVAGLPGGGDLGLR